MTLSMKFSQRILLAASALIILAFVVFAGYNDYRQCNEIRYEVEHSLHNIGEFARLTPSAPIPEDSTIMNFRHLPEDHQLASVILETINNYLRDKGLSLRQGTIVDATIIHAPSSVKNKEGKPDPEMRQTKKGNQYFFGMKAHIGADAESACCTAFTAQRRMWLM